MAHQSVRKYHSVGDYMVGKQIGSGSFSIVWHARHRIHGTEVAIKEINTARLNPKLHESLKSEIFILKRINHPNIIRLHDMIEEAGKIYIILEYCRGGDLHVYIQQKQGIIPEQTTKHFMLQLAEGLKVLRDNNLIHRDLKPQNLLLSTNEDNSTLKIADFGFARSLQPRGLAETLCGSPLYMAPEIMQSQKYDAKADLWSVGAILFQLATGKPPYNGSTQLQLLQNIIRATELQFPPEANDLSPHCIDLCKKLLRRNPVERLTFEEFFNHPYFLQNQPDELFRHRQSQYGFSPSERNREESTQEDCLPFILDDDYSGPDGSPSFSGRSTKKSMDGFSVDSMSGRVDISNLAIRTDSGKYRNSSSKTEIIGFNLGNRRLSEGSIDTRRKVVDSLESIDQDYVMVSGPKTDLSSSARALRSTHSSFKAGSPPVDSLRTNPTPSDPVPIIGGATVRVGNNESLESRMSAPGTSQGSMDAADTSEQPPTDFVTRIKSLQRCALAITEIVNDKVVGGKQLEALSIQLVILAIWKQALHICHTHAASAVEGSPGQDTRLRVAFKAEHSLDVQDSFDITKHQGTQELCSEIERTFLHEVENAEGLVKGVESGNAEMPDAMELIYQCALAWGRNGAVDEYMGNTETAVVFYSKAVRLLQFLLVEAPCLILNPPFSLTNSDRYRIQNYINVLINRQTISQSQRMALFKAEDQPPS